MTRQKMWVLKTHTKADEINDVGQNIRQDFVIYWNIVHQKAKKMKKRNKGKRIRHTNKQASKQINKRETKKRTKNQQPNKQGRSFFLWSDAIAGAIARGQTI